MTGTSAAGAALTDSATLGTTGAPVGLRVGSRTSESAGIFVIQNGPLAVLIGARSSPAAGYMEIGAP